MTPPRPIIPGRVWFLTARAVNQMFKFVPQRDVVQLFQYLFAVAAQQFGMSNHFHVLLTDVEGRLPDLIERPKVGLWKRAAEEREARAHRPA